MTLWCKKCQAKTGLHECDGCLFCATDPEVESVDKAERDAERAALSASAPEQSNTIETNLNKQ